MRKHFLQLFVALLAIVLVLVPSFGVSAADGKDLKIQSGIAPGAKKAPEAAKAPEGPAPKIVLEETMFDFGKQVSGESLKHTFKFKNEGKAPLLIEKVKAG